MITKVLLSHIPFKPVKHEPKPGIEVQIKGRELIFGFKMDKRRNRIILVWEKARGGETLHMISTWRKSRYMLASPPF
jgi:hypothetical protein